MRNQKGFTLVEIAIVLVIIGLILGGIIRGQAMIENARAKKFENDIQSFVAAFYTHLDKERRLPGAESGASLLGTTNAWKDLRDAGIIPGSGTDNATSPFGGDYAWDNATATGNSIIARGIPANIAEMLDDKNDDGDGQQGNILNFEDAPWPADGRVDMRFIVD